MRFNHDSGICWGFNVSIECEGFTGGNKSKTTIGIHPTEGCQFEIRDWQNVLYEAEKEDPVYLVFRGDCELESLISNVKFLLEILDGYKQEKS